MLAVYRALTTLIDPILSALVIIDLSRTNPLPDSRLLWVQIDGVRTATSGHVDIMVDSANITARIQMCFNCILRCFIDIFHLFHSCIYVLFYYAS